MRWLVEIVDIVADERLFTDLLAKLNVTLYLEDSRTYLTSDEFEQLSTSTEVWARAEQLRDVVTAVSKGFPYASISFQLGHLYEQKENASRSAHVFILGAGIGSTVTIGGTLTVTSTSEISEEERVRLEAERKEREYQERLELLSSRVVSAFRNERARKVQRLLQQDLTPPRMYYIYELIEADLGKKLDTLASKKERTRFTRSVNHQEVFGDDSRHATLNAEPPSDPMSLEEAQAFIQRVADLWFRQKC